MIPYFHTRRTVCACILLALAAFAGFFPLWCVKNGEIKSLKRKVQAITSKLDFAEAKTESDLKLKKCDSDLKTMELKLDFANSKIIDLQNKTDLKLEKCDSHLKTVSSELDSANSKIFDLQRESILKLKQYASDLEKFQLEKRKVKSEFDLLLEKFEDLKEKLNQEKERNELLEKENEELNDRDEIYEKDWNVHVEEINTLEKESFFQSFIRDIHVLCTEDFSRDLKVGDEALFTMQLLHSMVDSKNAEISAAREDLEFAQGQLKIEYFETPLLVSPRKKPMTSTFSSVTTPRVAHVAAASVDICRGYVFPQALLSPRERSNVVVNLKNQQADKSWIRLNSS